MDSGYLFLASRGRPHRLLTTSEVAEVLGIRSINTLKALVRVEGIETVLHGNRMMIPLSEVERLHDTARVRGIRVAECVRAPRYPLYSGVDASHGPATAARSSGRGSVYRGW